MTSFSNDHKLRFPIKIYAAASEEDFFLEYPNAVLLGFLGAVAFILLLLLLALWIGLKIW